MVEEDLRHVGVAPFADVDEHGIRLDARHAEHRGEQGGLVAADPVFVLERQLDVVRLVARRLLLGRHAHVADLLRDVGEDPPDPLVARGGAGDERVHRLLHLGDGRGHARFAELPVPAGEVLPRRDGGDEEPLRARVHRRHVRLGERLRHVPHAPAVERAAVRLRQRLVGDAGADLVAHADRLERACGGRGDFMDHLDDGHRVLEDGVVAEGVRHARLRRGARDDEVEDVAHFEPRQREGEDLAVGVEDVGVHLAGVDHEAAVARDVDGDGRAVGLDDLGQADGDGAVGGVHPERGGARFTTSFLGEDLLVPLVGARAGAVGAVAFERVVPCEDGVGVGIRLRGNGRGAGEQLGVRRTSGGAAYGPRHQQDGGEKNDLALHGWDVSGFAPLYPEAMDEAMTGIRPWMCVA